jgi:hypothetical protein
VEPPGHVRPGAGPVDLRVGDKETAAPTVRSKVHCADVAALCYLLCVGTAEPAGCQCETPQTKRCAVGSQLGVPLALRDKCFHT